MTMHIDEKILKRAMTMTGAKTKRAAVELALKEMVRRHKMNAVFREAIDLTPEEWANALDPKSYPDTDWSSPPRAAATSANGENISR